MTRDEFLKRIYETIDFICNKKTKRIDRTFTGQPHFFLLRTKEEFDEEYKKNPNILDTVYGDIDIELETTLEDILINNDTVLEFAIDYINNKKGI